MQLVVTQDNVEPGLAIGVPGSDVGMRVIGVVKVSWVQRDLRER